MRDLKMINEEGLWDMQRAASYLSIKVSTLYALCMRRGIPVCKIGKLNRFRKSDLDKFISDNMNEVRQ